MTKLNEILKKHELTAHRYEKRGKSTIVDTDDGIYVYKKGHIDNKILTYLKSRNFDYIPEILENDNYTLTRFIDDYDIPDEQKIIDLVKLTALLHSKTTHYKEIDLDYYESIYDDLDNNLKYLYSYYTDLITIIESKVFMSPSEGLLARNISKIYDTISENKKKLDSWHNLIKEKTKERNVILHNNLKLEHFIRNNNSYLISWDKSKIGSPIFDLYKLYQNHVLDFEFEDIFNTYEQIYPLTKDEKKLLDILISMPDIIELKDTEYNNCKNISHSIDKIYKTEKIISPKTSEQGKEK